MKPINLSAIALAALLGTPALAQNAQNQAEQGQPQGADIQVQQPAPEVTVEQPAPDIQVQQPQPQVTVEQPQPEVTVQQPKPQVTVEQAQPDVTVEQPKPEVTVQQEGQPEVTVQQQGQADVNVTEPGQATADQAQQPGSQNADAGTSADQNVVANPIYGMTGQELVGQTVYGANGENVGEIDNVVVGRNSNQGPAAIIGVGGFLGIGERDVAIPLDRLQLQGDRVTTSLTRDQIGGMRAYDANGWDTWDQNRPFNEAMNR
ncbi:MAG: PRC-barrel domain-containing protein [Geminicoccaceae bacterium]